jgi:hypothetical protein
MAILFRVTGFIILHPHAVYRRLSVLCDRLPPSGYAQAPSGLAFPISGAVACQNKKLTSLSVVSASGHVSGRAGTGLAAVSDRVTTKRETKGGKHEGSNQDQVWLLPRHRATWLRAGGVRTTDPAFRPISIPGLTRHPVAGPERPDHGSPAGEPSFCKESSRSLYYSELTRLPQVDRGRKYLDLG